jgi:pyruvate formate lyase activating enzyme
MKQTLRSVPVENVYFMGGEPTIAKELPEMLDFAKNELGARTYLGHTNGSHLPLPNLDGANVGLKAWDETTHEQYTGRPKQLIFDNVAAAVKAGLDVKANVVFVPGLVDLDQVEAIAAWLASLNPGIPFHIMGYIPVPGQPFPRPTEEQMVAARLAARRYLQTVACSHLSSEQALDLTSRDDRFAVRQIA